MVSGIEFWFWCMVSGVERRTISLALEDSVVLEVTTSFSQESTLGFLSVADLEGWRGRTSGAPWVEWQSSSEDSDPGGSDRAEDGFQPFRTG